MKNAEASTAIATGEMLAIRAFFDGVLQTDIHAKTMQ
jgi:hypothetical protein